MGKHKVFAIIFGLISFGAISELFRIITSNDSDIASQKLYLTIMAFIITILLLYLTRYFWKKSKI